MEEVPDIPIQPCCIDSGPLDEVLATIAGLVSSQLGGGRPAEYIPKLAEVPLTKFGMAVSTVAGGEYTIGDSDEPFSLQSITKVFSLGLALNNAGSLVWRRVGCEPSGTSFNHLSQVEAERGLPRNPFVNSGALVITDLLMGMVPDPALLVRAFTGLLAAQPVGLDVEVAQSEFGSAHKNRAIANLLRSFRAIRNDPEAVVEAYCRQCALTMSCRQLARAILPLANSGVSPLAREAVFAQDTCRQLNALLLTCGTYGSVGSFAYRVGLPAKSGVGGGIAAVIPGRASVAVWSPALDVHGTSIVGTAALESFVRLTNCSII